MSRRVGDEEEESYRPPKLPKTLHEKDSAKRLVVVLEGASLESVKVGKSYQLLNSSDHASIIRKQNRDSKNIRPDITHQCLLMLLDSPLNKAGLLQVYIHTARNVLIEVHPQTRIPRVFSRFCGLMVQLLHDLSISAKGSPLKLLKVIKNPITDHLPTGCHKICTSYSSKKLVRLRKFAEERAPDKPICFIVGAVAHGAVEPEWADDAVAVSGYAMSAAGVCAKLTDAFEEVWGVH
ncbi:C2f protein [Salpingoeca rosetta]|uniref:C2f protein n=1 Tax=Salpingoeca rosetta (strain ATCC 50818 / BSB-021) TaxID=946362 RepID=F2U443_SALR5|nr:C2f protein [Salpingoeca rosetta]EGD82409.1 C2f protein [Salpingoeca rosetta]|eukprot:XP_004995645.1 C2f protein [Salpingoeca rosetta]